jgi:replicative DNA helicase
MKKELPHDLDAEHGFLCSCMNENKVIGKTADRVNLDYFHFDANKHIWQAMLDMWASKKPIDLLTLTCELRGKGTLDEVGGEQHITNVYTFVPSHVNWDSYLHTMEDLMVRRRILNTCKRIFLDAFDRTIDTETLQASASKDITGMVSTKTEVRLAKEVLSACVNRWEEAARTGGEINRGHPSGISKWDIATRAFRPKTLHIIAGAAKAGKTTSALQMVTNPVIKCNVPIAIISMEMSAEEIMDKHIASISQIALSDLLDGKLRKEDHARLSKAISETMNRPIHIVDEACMNVSQFRARCRRLVAENKVEIIMVDYAQLMEGSNDPKSREREVAEVSRTAKIVAKELNVCIVLLAQLNENGAVRESRTFYMDCDSFTKIMPDEEGDSGEDYIMHITHNRHGGTFSIPLRFIKHQARFEQKIVEQ